MVVEAIGEQVVVGCSCRVVMATKNGFMGGSFCNGGRIVCIVITTTVAAQDVSWVVLFTHRNELLHKPSRSPNASWEPAFTDRNEPSSLPALPPMDGKA